MHDWLQKQLQRIWWTWDPSAPTTISQAYHCFNILEGCVWVMFSALVLQRYHQHRHSQWEIAYSLAFLSFGLTDFGEAWEQSTWLIAVKGLNVVVLFRLRYVIMKRFYPTAGLF